MNTYLVSLRNIQKACAVLAIFALVFGPFAKVNFAHAVTGCSVSVVSADGDDNAVATYVHPNWTKAIPDATWIWSDATVTDTTIDQTKVFTKTFNWNGDVSAANLQIAADNGYSVTLNGSPVGSSPASVDNFSTPASYDVSSLVVTGVNTLSFEVTNLATPSDTDPTHNPAGLLYKLDITGPNPHCMTLPSNTITVVKDFDGEAPSEWAFDFNSSFGPFTLTNGNDSTTTKLLDEGSYTISESLDSNTWDTPSVSCSNETVGENGQVTVNLGLEQNVTCTFTNHQKAVETPAPVCLNPDENLLQNPSFETPVISGNGGAWEPSSQTDWTAKKVSDASAIQLEFQNPSLLGWGGASKGNQSAELDGAESDTISQTIATVIGNKYKVWFDFGARPHVTSNSLDVLENGSTLGSVSADGTSDSAINWASHYYEFVADATSTQIEFKDTGNSDEVGTLLDNTGFCLTQDNQEVPVQTYRIFGNVWNDVNQNNATDTDEANLSGLGVQITNGDTTLSTTTDANGNYYFDVPEGTWTITEQPGEDWTVTYPSSGSYTVTVPPVTAEAPAPSIFASIMSTIIPTALAAALPVQPHFGPFNFGNKAVVHGTGTPSRPHGGGAVISLSSGGGSSTSSASTTNGTSDGRVLGAATTTIPVGAPATGAGGTSPLVVNLPTLAAILPLRSTAKKAKHG